ncbi:MAG: LuxR family transcriptional regulator [Proteobacteria bacterium]|nr:LuxR family transcriptional regulator [Pseudomonadota bacterium]
MAAGGSDAGDFNACLRRLATPAECAALFAKAIAPLGFDTFASGEVDLQDRSRSSFHIINWPDSWAKFYRESGLIDRDPIVEGLAHRTSAFTWSDLRADRSFSRLGTHALDLAAAAGWSEGFVVPLPQASGRIGLVSLAGNRDCTDPDERHYLTLISICLHSYVRTLVGRHGFALPPAGLTPRELEAVRLVARGMSDLAIGQTLGIADSTAHEFVEKAKRKMKVRSRAELAALAAALAIVDL